MPDLTFHIDSAAWTFQIDRMREALLDLRVPVEEAASNVYQIQNEVRAPSIDPYIPLAQEVDRREWVVPSDATRLRRKFGEAFDAYFVEDEFANEPEPWTPLFGPWTPPFGNVF